MKISFLTLLFVAFSNIFFLSDVSDDIAVAIRSGNAKEISKHFSDNIDLKILDKEDIYSKAQSELIIKDFFIKHPVKTFTIVHKSASKNDAQYAIGLLETSNGKFRIYFLLKKNADKLLIQQFRIESENE